MYPSLRATLVAVGIVAADQLSKLAASNWTPSGSDEAPRWSADMFSIVPVENGGVIGGLGVERPDLLPAAAVLALVLLLALARRLTAGSTVGAALALGGAAGNLIDRVRLGHVIDFLAVDLGVAQIVLNLADVALFIGLPMLVLAARGGDGERSAPRLGTTSDSVLPA